MGFGLLVDKDSSITVHDLCIVDWFGINPLVGDGSVSGCQFQVADTMGNTAEAEGRTNITVYLSIGSGLALYQRGDPEIQCVLITELGGDGVHHGL